MKKDIILAGVGGQGILSIATVISEAATKAGLWLKQAEVHGMSQRGGDVQSNLRLCNEPIQSDLIPKGDADLIIAMEPMEALRYVPYLNKKGWVISAATPFINIPNYPDLKALRAELQSLPHVDLLKSEGEEENKPLPKGANMTLLGLAAKYIEILTPEELRAAIAIIFGSKGPEMVEANQKAFDLGLQQAVR